MRSLKIVDYIDKIDGVDYGCGQCYECLKDVPVCEGSPMMIPSTMMILCPECGNKRCTKATDHSNECSGSNATNQYGSNY